jgi:sugar phosphate isomerase/epimerase
MLRLGIRGHDVPVTGSFEDWVGAIADQGFCCTQLALKKAVKEFYVGTDAMTSGMAMYMRNVFAKKDVNVSVLGCYLNVTTPDEEEWAAVKKTYEAHFRFAKFLGCGMVGTETGAMNKEYKPGPENRTEEALAKLIGRVKELTDIAEKYGVCLGIEPVVRHNMYNIERTKRVVEAVASPNLRVILDAVNLLDPSNCDKQEEILDEAFEKLNEHIDVLHIKDYINTGDTLKTTDLVVGEGELCLSKILAYAKAKKPCIEILIEDSNPGNIAASKANIERIYAGL